MAEFKAITSQEEFDAAIGARLDRERKSLAAQYADYDDIKTQNAGYDQQLTALQKQLDDATAKGNADHDSIAALTAQVATYETNSVKMRVAHEHGLPFNIASRLAGSTEDEIRADAAELASYFATPPSPAPLKSLEPSGIDAKDSALRAFASSLTEKGE